MTFPLVVPMPGNDAMAAALADLLAGEIGRLETRSFPDGETYLRFLSQPAGRQLLIVCTLNRPDEKVLPLLFAAAAARDCSAVNVGLVAPYLAYMRQDSRFNPGEAVTSKPFASLISDAFDWLVTIDPHLHRYHALSQIYRIPSRAVHAAPLISRWIKAHVSNPLVIGPDEESEQWVAAVAKDADAPYALLSKVRHGDRDVEISTDNLGALGSSTPVLVDDIISSGRTMLQAVSKIAPRAAQPPICIGVHGLFADQSDVLLARAGARVVTCNTVPHASNEIDVSEVLASAIRQVQLS